MCFSSPPIKPMYSFGKLAKIKSSPMGFVYTVLWILIVLWIVLSEIPDILRKFWFFKIIFRMPPMLIWLSNHKFSVFVPFCHAKKCYESVKLNLCPSARHIIILQHIYQALIFFSCVCGYVFNYFTFCCFFCISHASFLYIKHSDSYTCTSQPPCLSLSTGPFSLAMNIAILPWKLIGNYAKSHPKLCKWTGVRIFKLRCEFGNENANCRNFANFLTWCLLF